jgi:hypothetical protein
MSITLAIIVVALLVRMSLSHTGHNYGRTTRK